MVILKRVLNVGELLPDHLGHKMPRIRYRQERQAPCEFPTHTLNGWVIVLVVQHTETIERGVMHLAPLVRIEEPCLVLGVCQTLLIVCPHVVA